MKYPVYVISKGRFNNCLTADYFIEDGLDFKLVVEPKEYDEYLKKYDSQILIKLEENLSERKQGSYPVRNFVWEHSIKNGYTKHWIFDDNIRGISKWHNNKRIRCNSSYAIKALEDFTDRYTNVAISGFNYTMFAHQSGKKPKDPFWSNVHVYSALLIDNSLPFRWRLKYNEDVDLCLQALTRNYCTILFNAFTINKMRNMTAKGGNTDTIYKDNGLINKTMSLKEIWRDEIIVRKRFGRLHHIVNWNKYKTPLKRKRDIDFSTMPKIDNYGMKLTLKVSEESAKNG